MKTSLSAGLDAHYQLGTNKLASIIRIERADAVVHAFTSAQTGFTLDGQWYDPGVGLDASQMVTSSGLAVDNLEMTVLQDDAGVFALPDALGGLWYGATFAISECNWSEPSDGPNPLMSGTFGVIKLRKGNVVVELRDVKQLLQQTIVKVVSLTCRTRLGSLDQCKVDLAPLRKTGTITSVTSGQIFADSSRTEADDWFTKGTFRFLTGDCAGLAQLVKGYALSSKQFTLSLPMLPAVQVGDTYEVWPGCRKRFIEDCVTKFNNGLNFDGEPHTPSNDALTQR